ncbi:MAG: hypothetical protein JW768_07135 [Chitinispirillaceae bacterium]|nr:hypothetical protein [Chitinispirillaceae bacterium]
MIVRLVSAVLCSAVVVLYTGCSEVPHHELSEAKEALEDAKKAGAEAYAPSQLQAAQVSYELAMKEISAERRKVPFVRRYDNVIETLENTISAAKCAEKAVETTKKRIGGETQVLMTQVDTIIDSLDAILSFALKRQKDVGTLEKDLDSIKIAAMSASTAIGAGELLLAKEKAMEAHGKAVETMKLAGPLIPPPKKPRKRR